MKLMIFSLTCFCILFLSNAKSLYSYNTSQGVQAANVGGWLVIEEWIKPSLFSKIPNKDFLDGTSLQLKSTGWGKYLSAVNGGGSNIIANSTTASDSETFKLWRINETTFNFRVFNKQFVGLDHKGKSSVVVSKALKPGVAETFQIYKNPRNSSQARIKASNGLFLQVKSMESVTADYEGDGSRWEDEDPSIFLLTIRRTMLGGEFQLTNGLGPDLAPQVMEEHWRTFIVEEDFEFMKNNGVNTVRIPFGWWIAYNNPPKPFVKGSLQALDNAFLWAKKYQLNVILDLHAAPGSQNGGSYSGSRDGSQEWGKTDKSISQTVHVIDFLTKRYAKNPSLYAVGLISEPFSPGVSLDTLKKYYVQGYNVVRSYSKTLYVVVSNLLGEGCEPKQVFNLTKGMTNSVIDVHYFNLFSDYFHGLTVQQNIEYIYNNRTKQLKELTTKNGPLVFVGEWSAQLPLTNVTKKDVQRYAKAQLQVYGNTTFGWAYWTLKNENNYWSLEWMIKNKYIKL